MRNDDSKNTKRKKEVEVENKEINRQEITNLSIIKTNIVIAK